MKKLLSVLLTLCMVLTLLPISALAAAERATTVTVGGVTLNADNPYATTNADGEVTLGGDEDTYNVKFDVDADTSTLTLRNANIKDSTSSPAIYNSNNLTIMAEGTNAVTASDSSAAIYVTSGNLTFEGSGALTAVSNQTVAVYASNITVRESITLTAVGGTLSESPGGTGLEAFNDIKIKGSARVTALGGKSSAGSAGSAGIRAGENVTIGGSATVTAVGGGTSFSGYSAGISAHTNGTITIGGSAKVVAVGGNAGTNASYGLYAHGTGTITYTGGLLVAKGGKADTSLAMNKAATGDGLGAAEVTNNDGTSKYCVVSPKTGVSPGPPPTAVYHVMATGVTSSTDEVDNHILWNGDNLHLINTIVIAPDGDENVNTALNMNDMPENAMLTLEGYNVLLAGDGTSDSIALEGGITSSSLIVAGSGDLTAISGSADQCYGIVNAEQILSTGTITAIGGSGSHSYGIYGPASISSGKVIAIGGESSDSYGIYKGSGSGTLSISDGSGVAVGRNSAFNTAPTITGLSAMGAYTDKLMAWGAVFVPPAATCHLTVNLNGGSGGTLSGDYTPGASVPIDAGTRAGYSFSGWTASGGNSPFADASSPSTIFTMPPIPVTITANWNYIGGGSGGGGITMPKYEAEVAGGGSSVKTDVTVDAKKSSASAELSEKDLKNGADFVVTMPNISGVTHYDLGLPVASLTSDSETGSIRLRTDLGSVTLPSNMLTGTGAASGTTARINIGRADSSALPDSAQAAVGSRPLVSLSLSVDGKPADWSNDSAPVTVRIPYTPAKGEDPNAVVIWYIDGAGKLNCVTNGRYDHETGTVAFQTTHFSLYAVGYNNVAFTDVADGAWHHSAVTYLAARGITSGTTDTTFSPDATLTRGQFITLLLRAYEITADANPTDNFSDAGNTYYTGYLAAAKRLGISDGVGDNRFAPEQAITRQEMFTLLYNALKALDKLPKGDSGKTLADFTDSSSVASWAKEAMTVLVKSGTVSGSDGKLSPASGSTRAQMAQVLYTLLSK